MEVITGINLNKKFKKIPEYRMDLGLAIKVDDSGKKGDYGKGGGPVWKIKDKTIKKYYENYGKYLNRVGKIGTLLFYTDNTISSDNIYILHKNEVYESEYKDGNIRTFLSDLITDVLEGNLEPYNKITETKEEFVDLKNMSNEELAEYFRKNR